MDNKKEWEELEKWNTQRIINEKEKSKFYFEEFNKNQNVDTLVKGLKISGNVIKTITLIIILIIVVISLILIKDFLSYLRGKVAIDVVPTIQNMYGINVKVISKNVNKEGDGIYRLQVKQDNIQFNAIKQGKALKEDFLDRIHKYYFENWNSTNKGKFKVKEVINNEIMEYDTYIEITNYEEIENVVNTMFEFENFCGVKYFRMWNIYVIIDGKKVFPYTNTTSTSEEVINYIKNIYNYNIT